MTSATDMNRVIYEYAELARKETSDPSNQAEQLDLSPVPYCFHCNTRIVERKALLCSGCGSTVFCSRECHIAEWKHGHFGAKNHKFFCPKNKRHMEKVPQVLAILKQFPWGRVEKDGTFADQFARAYYGVLGHEGFGYWSIPAGIGPHLPRLDTRDITHMRFGTTGGYQHGYQLLLKRHLDEQDAWKLDSRLIPTLHFEPGTEPAIASSVNVVDWKSWYQWRNLSMESPAALLMHYPMTTYQLLVHTLHVSHPSRNSPEHRQALNVHYLGPEVELNMLPLFSELALLLPYTDIKLTMFGPAVYNIVGGGKQGSLAMKAKRNSPVYTHNSPMCMGGSTLAIYLHGEHEYWDARLPFLTGNVPDAIVATNAGLLTYATWSHVIMYCHVADIPFAITEYAEQSAELQAEALPQMILDALPHLQGLNSAGLEKLVAPRTYTIAMNPFQRPGQRYLGSARVPNVSNGFVFKIVGCREVDSETEMASQHEAAKTISREAQDLVKMTKDMSIDGLD